MADLYIALEEANAKVISLEEERDALRAELAAAKNLLARIHRDGGHHTEAAEWAAKLLAEAQTQERIAQRLADLSAGRELEAVQRAAELEAQLADARLDSARLDCVLKFMNDQRQFWLFLYLHKTRLQTTRGDADLDEWRKWIDAAIDAAIKEAK